MIFEVQGSKLGGKIDLGPSWRPFGGLLGPLGGISEASWSDFDVKLEPTHHKLWILYKKCSEAQNYYIHNIFSMIFEVQGVQVGRKNRSWDLLKAFWRPLGASGRHLGAS